MESEFLRQGGTEQTTWGLRTWEHVGMRWALVRRLGWGMEVEREKERSGRGLADNCPNIHLRETLLEVRLTNVLTGVIQTCLENCNLLFATVYSSLPSPVQPNSSPKVSFQSLPT